MECRFYLLDISEDELQGKPCVRLWGIDEKGKRILILANQIMPYFYFLPDGTIDIVGLEVVRGDWSDIAYQVQEQVLENILRDQSSEKAIETVRTTIRRLQNGEVSIADLTIRKALTKPIESYAVRALTLRSRES